MDSSSLILTGLFAAGIVCLYLLGSGKGPATASASQQTIQLEVDSALSRMNKSPLTDPNTQRAAEVVSPFYDRAKRRQVPLGEVRGNPFILDAIAGLGGTNAKSQGQAPPSNTDGQSLRLTKALKDAEQLRLHAVIIGTSRPTAVISNNLVSEGQQISGWTVKKIEARKVVLAFESHTYALELPN
jgi:hypothetical protein